MTSEFEKELRNLRNAQEREAREQLIREEQERQERAETERRNFQRLTEENQKAKHEIFVKEVLPLSPMVEKLLKGVANATWGTNSYHYTFQEEGASYLSNLDFKNSGFGRWVVGGTKKRISVTHKRFFSLPRVEHKEIWVPELIPIDRGIEHHFYSVDIRQNNGDFHFSVPQREKMKSRTEGTGEEELKDLLKEEFVRGYHVDNYKELFPPPYERG